MKLLLTTFFVLAFCLTTFSQEKLELFTKCNVKEEDLLDSERQSIEKVKIKSGKNDKLLVNISSIEKVFKNNKYEFTLPITDKKVIVQPIRTEYMSEKEYTIFGKMEDSGDFIYTSKSDQKSIFMSFQDYTYQVNLIENSKDKYLVVRHDKKSDSTAITCGTMPSPIKEKPKSNKRVANFPLCEDSDKLRVMVLYTQNSTNYISNMWAEASTGINQFNAACWNSGIGQIQAELVGPFPLSNWTESAPIENEVGAMLGNSDIENLRELHKADLVVLIGHHSSWQWTGRTIDYTQDINNSFAVLMASYVNVQYNFVHLLSHLLSTRHEQCSVVSSSLCDDTHPFSHAWYFGSFWSGYYRTVEFHSSAVGGSIINHFSNPNVSYNGFSTGTSVNDNARRMVETFPYVKYYKYGPGLLKASLGTPGNYDPYSTYQTANTTYTFSGAGSCALAPYEYNWEVSTDGVNFSWAGTGSTFSIYLGEYDYKIVRLKVYSSDLQVAYKTVTLMSLCVGCRIGVNEILPQRFSVESLNKINTEGFELLKLFPNPVRNQFKLSFRVPREGQVKIEMVDLQGKIISTLSNKRYPTGVHYLTYECMNEQAGAYLCKMEIDGTFVATHKFIVEK